MDPVTDMHDAAGRAEPGGGGCAFSPGLLILCALLIGGLGGPAPAASAQIPGVVAGTEEEAEPERPLLSIADSVAYDALESRLQAAFGHIEAFENVRVEVADGVVELSGRVARAEARERAEELAYRFEEVLYVENAIEAETDLERRVSPAVARVRAWSRAFLDYLPILGIALGILLLFGVLARLINRWDAPFASLGVNPLLRDLIQQVVGLVVFGLGLLLVLEILDATALAGALMGAAGLAGLAIGFAFRDIVENYLAGALLSLRRPFGLNDFVAVGGDEGRVLRLSARELVLLTLDGNHVRIPNATVFKSIIRNYTRDPRRRFDFAVGVSVDEDLARVQQLGRQTLEAMAGVLREPRPFGLIEELGDWSVVVRFFGWMDQEQSDYFKVRSEAVRLVKAALDEAGVVMPEPISQVRLRPWDSEPEQRSSARIEPKIGQAAAEADVAPEPQLDAQIRDELERSDGQNLLLPPGARGS